MKVANTLDPTESANKPRHATPTSRPVSLILCIYNLNLVIDVRPHW